MTTSAEIRLSSVKPYCESASPCRRATSDPRPRSGTRPVGTARPNACVSRSSRPASPRPGLARSGGPGPREPPASAKGPRPGRRRRSPGRRRCGPPPRTDSGKWRSLANLNGGHHVGGSGAACDQRRIAYRSSRSRPGGPRHSSRRSDAPNSLRRDRRNSSRRILVKCDVRRFIQLNLRCIHDRHSLTLTNKVRVIPPARCSG